MLSAYALACAAVLLATISPASAGLQTSDERIVLQTTFGDLELALYTEVAPVTTQHIMMLARMGAYNTNEFFRVDKGFVLQTQDVRWGRTLALDTRQQHEADKTVPLEVRSDVKHDRRGLLSMARADDPNSGGSSFSIMLGPAPHLDMQYTLFGEVTAGLEVLDKIEQVETKKEGIFVMPLQRIQIDSSYVYTEPREKPHLSCEQEVLLLKDDLLAQTHQLERLRSRLLP